MGERINCKRNEEEVGRTLAETVEGLVLREGSEKRKESVSGNRRRQRKSGKREEDGRRKTFPEGTT